jgi:signal peptidase I
MSGSMEPTLPVGTKVIVNKWTYRFQPPQRGDIVSFPSPAGGKGLVKRVIAVAGEKVRLCGKQVYINGPTVGGALRQTHPCPTSG